MGRKKARRAQNRQGQPNSPGEFGNLGTPKIDAYKESTGENANFGEEVVIPKNAPKDPYKTVFLTDDAVTTSNKSEKRSGSSSSSYHDLIDGGAYHQFRSSHHSLNRSRPDFESAGDRIIAGSRSISHRSLFADSFSGPPKTIGSMSLQWDDGDDRIERHSGNSEEFNTRKSPHMRSRTVSSGGSNRNSNLMGLQPFSSSQRALDSRDDVRTYHANSDYLQNHLSKLSIHSNNDEFVLVGGHPPSEIIDSTQNQPVLRPRSRASSLHDSDHGKRDFESRTDFSKEIDPGRSYSQLSLDEIANTQLSRSSSRHTMGTNSNTDDNLLLAARYGTSPEAEGLTSHRHRSRSRSSVFSEHVEFAEIPTLYSHPDEKFDDNEPGEPFRPTSEHQFTPTGVPRSRPSLTRSNAVPVEKDGYSSSSSSLSKSDKNQPLKALLVTSALTPVIPKRNAMSHSEESIVMKTPQTVQRASDFKKLRPPSVSSDVKKTVEIAVQTGNSIRLRQNQQFTDVLSECAYLPEPASLQKTHAPTQPKPIEIPSSEGPVNTFRARLRHISDIYSTDDNSQPKEVEIPKNSSKYVEVPKNFSNAPKFVEVPKNFSNVPKFVEIPKSSASLQKPKEIVVPIQKSGISVDVANADTIRKHIPRGRIRDLAAAFDKVTDDSPLRPVEPKFLNIPSGTIKKSEEREKKPSESTSSIPGSTRSCNRSSTSSGLNVFTRNTFLTNSNIKSGTLPSNLAHLDQAARGDDGFLTKFNKLSASSNEKLVPTNFAEENSDFVAKNSTSHEKLHHKPKFSNEKWTSEERVESYETLYTRKVTAGNGPKFPFSQEKIGQKPGHRNLQPENEPNIWNSHGKVHHRPENEEVFEFRMEKGPKYSIPHEKLNQNGNFNEESALRATETPILHGKNDFNRFRSSSWKQEQFPEYSRKVPAAPVRLDVPIQGRHKKPRFLAESRAKTQEIPSGTFEFESRYEERALSGDLNNSEVFGMQKPLFAASREAFGRETAEDLSGNKETWRQPQPWASEYKTHEEEVKKSEKSQPVFITSTQYQLKTPVESMEKRSIRSISRHPYSPPVTEDAGSRITHHTSQTLQSEDLFATEDSSIRGKIDRMFDFVENEDSRKTMKPHGTLPLDSHASTDTIGTNGNGKFRESYLRSSLLGAGKSSELISKPSTPKIKSPERRKTVTVPELEFFDNELEYSLTEYREMQREQLRRRLPSADEPEFFRSPTMTAPHAGQSMHAYRTRDLLGTPTAGEKFRFPSSASGLKLHPSALATSTPLDSPASRTSFSLKEHPDIHTISPPNDTFVSSISGISATDKHVEVMRKINRMSYMIENTQKQMTMNEAALADALKKGRRSQEIAAHRSILITRETLRLQRTELRRLHALSAVRRPPPPVAKELRGSVVFKDLVVHLNKLFVSRLTAKDDNSYSFVALFKFEHQVEATELVPLRVYQGEEACDKLFFVKQIQFSDVPIDFNVKIEIYAMRVTPLKPVESSLGSSFANKCKSLMGPPQKKTHYQSSETAFKFRGYLVLDRDASGDRCLYLEEVTYPLEGTIMIKTQCSRLPEAFEVDYRGFLSMFHTVSHMASWERYWAVVRRGVVLFWKYPEDEQNGKEPRMQIDLTKCTNNSIEKCAFDLCPRANSFVVEILVDCDDSTIGSVVEKKRVLLSADTSEMLSQWLFTLNQTLDIIRGPI